MKYAQAWGYDHDKRQFMLRLSDHVPCTRAVIHLEAKSGPTAIATIDIGPSAELRIPLIAQENEWISGELRIGSQVIDTFGCRTDRVNCPHCKFPIEREVDLEKIDKGLIWRMNSEQLAVFNKHRRFVAASIDDAGWLVWYLNTHLADFDHIV